MKTFKTLEVGDELEDEDGIIILITTALAFITMVLTVIFV